jgi:hypothetical protein
LSTEEDTLMRMTEMPHHVLGELSTYLSGRLSGADRRRVEAHLQECGSCQAHADSLEALRGRTTEGLTRYGPGSDFSWMRIGAWVGGIALVLIVGRFVFTHRTATPPKSVEAPAPKAEPVKPPPAAPVPEAEVPVPASTAETANSEPAATPAAAPAPASPAGAAAQWKGIYSGISEFRPVIIQTPEAWQELWQQHVSNRAPAPPVPAVDFNQSIVVGVYSGNKPTAGYDVEITNLNMLPDQLLVEYKETAPAEGSIAAQVVTTPFHIRVIPKTDRPIRFQKL